MQVPLPNFLRTSRKSCVMQELISLSIGTLDFCGGLEVYGVALRVITI